MLWKIRFNVVRIGDDRASLSARLELKDYCSAVVIDQGFAYLSGPGYSAYWGMYDGYYGTAGELTIIDLADPENPVKYEHTLAGGGVQVIGAKRGNIFVRSSNEIGCYDVTDPQHPGLDEYKSQSNWIYRVIFSGGNAYVPLGYAGLWVKNLE